MAGSLPALSVRDVSKRFDTPSGRAVEALSPVSFDIWPDEFVSLVGPSGCGKSTLFNVIAGLDTPTTGTLELNGIQLDDLQGRVAYQLQKDLLLPWRTILDNVVLGLEIQGVARAERYERGTALLKQYGLGAFVDRHPFELSGGMRQRAALIRTLLFDRPVILLDEPFGALDAQTRVLMQEWLRDLARESRKTILLITHDIDEAILLSSRVLIMSARPGTIKADVPIELSQNPVSELIFDPGFVQYKRELFAMVREESLRAFEESQLTEMEPRKLNAAK